MMNSNILETIRMIEEEKLDIRTVTMGISLLDCADSDGEVARRKIYEKITTRAANLVSVCEGIEAELGIPIVNKRIAVTPIALVAGASDDEDYVEFARTLDAAAKAVGVNFVGGFSALVDKGMTPADEKLIRSIPRALAETDVVCSSVDIGSSRAGINMSAVKLMGETIRATADLTADTHGFGCAKLVVFANAVSDNPFMAGAFHGVQEADTTISVGVSGPGVVHRALQKVRGESFDTCAEEIKKAAFKITRVGQLVAWACNSTSSTSPWHPPPRSVTPWLTSSRRWVWKPSAPTAPSRPSRCSTTRLRREVSWPARTSAVFPAPSFRSLRISA